MTTTRIARPAASLVIAWVALTACGAGKDATSETSGAGPTTTPGTVVSPSDPAPSSSGSPSSPAPPAGDAGASPKGDAGGPGPSVIANASCTSPTPAGAAVAPTLPVYAGTCPALATSPAFTSITSSGAERKFLVFRPQTIAASETLPVVFLWHWLGGSPEDMGSALEVQAAVEARRFIGVVPAPKGDAAFRWPFDTAQSQSRVDEEAVFFDDMLACVGAALPVNKDCVSSAGVSAGALWTAQLGALRSTRLSSIVSLSGGTGTSVVRPWSTATHRLPALVLWGGEDDTYPSQIPLMNFEDASNDLMGKLTSDNHFIVECVHNCGHAVPPFDAPPAGGLRFDPIWRFVLDHPFWLGAAQSPYKGKPLSTAYPTWCAIGKGSATPRPNNAACE